MQVVISTLVNDMNAVDKCLWKVLIPLAKTSFLSTRI